MQIGIVAIGLARQERLHLVAIRAIGKSRESIEALALDIGIALGLTHLDELHRVGHLAFDFAHGVDRGFETLLFLRDRLRLLGIVPQRGILDARVELVEPTQRLLPVERLAHQRKSGFDTVDMGLPFGTHRKFLRICLASPLISAGRL